MTPEEIRRRVLEAVERGKLPRGGPSHLAALDRKESADYWERWSIRAAARIRAQAMDCTCSNEQPREHAGDGRCSRCWGRVAA
jgi:hypothetical protein